MGSDSLSGRMCVSLSGSLPSDAGPSPPALPERTHSFVARSTPARTKSKLGKSAASTSGLIERKTNDEDDNGRDDEVVQKAILNGFSNKCANGQGRGSLITYYLGFHGKIASLVNTK